MKDTIPKLCFALATAFLLPVGIAHSGEVSLITSAFEGSSVPIGGSGILQYDLTTTQPTTNVTSITFESRLRFYSKFVANGGNAQLFRPNINYSIGFQVSDPDQVGYRIKIQRRIIGVSSINWTGFTGTNSSTGSVSYETGLVRVNGILQSDLRSGNFVSRVARESNPTPPDASHRFERSLTLSGYKGTQSFTISDREAAAQVVNAFQNNNIGSAELFFGVLPILNGYSNAVDESGDSFIVTVIFNPTCTIQHLTPTTTSLAFTGILQESIDLERWTDVSPQPMSPLQITPNDASRFFRARSIE